MKVVKKISVDELKEMANKMFGDLVKADVDIDKKIVIVDMPMHYDGEAELIARGSANKDIWGINLYPTDFGTDKFVEFDSMINIRPSQGNVTRSIADEKVRQQIVDIVTEVVYE